jgi:serine O-acetyltransferase
MRDPAWQADIARVEGTTSVWREQSLWAIWVYRFGQRVDRRPDGFGKRLLRRVYSLLFFAVETATGICIPKECTIGKGLRIWHFGGIFINGRTVIGDNCTLRHGVTIGNRYNDLSAPVIGNNVEIGAGAQILGTIRIGDHCRIGALTAVLDDMPDGSTAVGQAARIIRAGEGRNLETMGPRRQKFSQ